MMNDNILKKNKKEDVGVKINYHLLTSIYVTKLCRIADSLLWIPKSSRRTSSISTYLILLPY
ncbi:SX2_G0023550.mRNA.1.CDS.1 [Saccharomyces cerevisiae]|nr:SX2_G0023550.mRNA.1.CDS.1 [Saccharomyces cerevisiae]